MNTTYTNLLLEAGELIHKARSNRKHFEIIAEYTNTALQPDLSCFYLKQKLESSFKLIIKKGFTAVPETLLEQSELLGFLYDSKEIVCLNTRKQSPFAELLLSANMESGLAVPLFLWKKEEGILIVNSMKPFFFKHKEILFLENIRRLK